VKGRVRRGFKNKDSFAKKKAKRARGGGKALKKEPGRQEAEGEEGTVCCLHSYGMSKGSSASGGMEAPTGEGFKVAT